MAWHYLCQFASQFACQFAARKKLLARGLLAAGRKICCRGEYLLPQKIFAAAEDMCCSPDYLLLWLSLPVLSIRPAFCRQRSEMAFVRPRSHSKRKKIPKRRSCEPSRVLGSGACADPLAFSRLNSQRSRLCEPVRILDAKVMLVRARPHSKRGNFPSRRPCEHNRMPGRLEE